MNKGTMSFGGDNGGAGVKCAGREPELMEASWKVPFFKTLRLRVLSVGMVLMATLGLLIAGYALREASKLSCGIPIILEADDRTAVNPPISA